VSAGDRGTTTRRPSRGAFATMLVATLGAPSAWAVYLISSYVYVPAACAGWPMWALHLFTVLALVAIAGAALASWVIGRGHYSGAPIRGQRYLAMFGGVLSGYFAFVTLFHGWANFVADPCTGIGLPVS
jgi:hypothetical protein